MLPHLTLSDVPSCYPTLPYQTSHLVTPPYLSYVPSCYTTLLYQMSHLVTPPYPIRSPILLPHLTLSDVPSCTTGLPHLTLSDVPSCTKEKPTPMQYFLTSITLISKYYFPGDLRTLIMAACNSCGKELEMCCRVGRGFSVCSFNRAGLQRPHREPVLSDALICPNVRCPLMSSPVLMSDVL